MAVDSPIPPQDDAVAAVRGAWEVSADDLAVWSDIVRGAEELPTPQLPLVSEPATCTSDSTGGADEMISE